MILISSFSLISKLDLIDLPKGVVLDVSKSKISAALIFDKTKYLASSLFKNALTK